MPDEKQEEKKEHPVDAYLRATGRQETAAVTFADLKSLADHKPAPAEEKPAATS